MLAGHIYLLVVVTFINSALSYPSNRDFSRPDGIEELLSLYGVQFQHDQNDQPNTDNMATSPVGGYVFPTRELILVDRPTSGVPNQRYFNQNSQGKLTEIPKKVYGSVEEANAANAAVLTKVKKMKWKTQIASDNNDLKGVKLGYRYSASELLEALKSDPSDIVPCSTLDDSEECRKLTSLWYRLHFLLGSFVSPKNNLNAKQVAQKRLSFGRRIQNSRKLSGSTGISTSKILRFGK